MEIHGTNFPE